MLKGARTIADLEGAGQIGATHVGEALQYAELLERPTEILLARLALAQASRQRDRKQFKLHVTAIDAMASAQVADWARDRARTLLG